MARLKAESGSVRMEGELLACWSGPGDTLSGRRPKAGSGGGGRPIPMEANGD